MKTPQEIKDRINELTHQDVFIDGIFNYCDRWCEKCLFTSKCLNYAISEGETLDGTEGWSHLKNVIDATCIMLDELMDEYGINPSDPIVIGPIHNPETHPLSMYVKDTVFRIHDWLGKNDLFQRLNNLRELGIPLSSKFSRYKESVEIIYRYNFFIGAKITRAVAGLLENRQYCHCDMNGSAKIALVCIDRLILAWSCILNESSEVEDEVLEFLIHLTNIRKRTEMIFPEARKFIRPGLDDQN